MQSNKTTRKSLSFVHARSSLRKDSAIDAGTSRMVELISEFAIREDRKESDTPTKRRDDARHAGCLSCLPALSNDRCPTEHLHDLLGRQCSDAAYIF